MTSIVLPTAPQKYDPAWANHLVRKLQQALDEVNRAASSATWTVSPAATADRTIDPTAESTDDVRQIVATLIEDLRARGVLG